MRMTTTKKQAAYDAYKQTAKNKNGEENERYEQKFQWVRSYIGKIILRIYVQVWRLQLVPHTPLSNSVTSLHGRHIANSNTANRTTT